MLAATARALSRTAGWRRLATAFVFGAAAIFAFAPFYIVPVLLLCFPAFLWLLDGCKTRGDAIAVGWAFGFGHFAASYYWLTSAFMVDAAQFGAIAWPAVMALSAAVGLFISIVAVITQLIAAPREDDMPDDRVTVRALRLVLFAAAWTLIEWVRSWIFTGFPWNPLAAVWSETATPIGGAVIQITALIGTYGLSFVTVLAALAPYVLAQPPRFAHAWKVFVAPLVLLAVVGAGGAVRLASATSDFVPGVKLRLVQANIPQVERARQSLWKGHLGDYLALSTENRGNDITHVIWGEAAVPPITFLNLSSEYREIVARAAPPNGLLITGGDRGLRDDNGIAIYNSFYVLTPTGEIAATYDKHHLVPFGEYMPMRWLVPYEKITGGVGDFAAGPGLVTLQPPGLPPFTPLICYEAVFSGGVTPKDGPKPQWLLNVTNDAWFGMSTGPHQHYAAARLRAVEEGLPLVRAANTGISAVIDGYGRTVAALALGERGVLDAPLPTMAASFTPFGVGGNFIPVILAAAAGLMALMMARAGVEGAARKR
jgi:apolipoprotein N-acyltransferase